MAGVEETHSLPVAAPALTHDRGVIYIQRIVHYYDDTDNPILLHRPAKKIMPFGNVGDAPTSSRYIFSSIPGLSFFTF